MTSNEKEDRRIYWAIGKNLTKGETKTAALTLVFGMISALVMLLIPIEKSKVIDYAVISLCSLAGYVIGRRHFE